VGDIVSFTFNPKNHTVTQSSFAAPCTPVFGGFDTGLYVLSFLNFSHRAFIDTSLHCSVPVANASISPLPTRQFTVNDVRAYFLPI
jgi:hypothetical protein